VLRQDRHFATLTPAETVLWYHARGLYNLRVTLTLRVVARLDLPLESYARHRRLLAAQSVYPKNDSHKGFSFTRTDTKPQVKLLGAVSDTEHTCSFLATRIQVTLKHRAAAWAEGGSFGVGRNATHRDVLHGLTHSHFFIFVHSIKTARRWRSGGKGRDSYVET
jgi:hypothetical protein